MTASASFLAIDLGASSGRLMDCRWDGRRFEIEELHRFPNGGVRSSTGLYWDVASIWNEIRTGLRKFTAQGREAPAAIGIDAWGVDYCLLDGADRLLGNPYHYRDARTNGLPEAMSAVVTGRELFNATGVQTMAINTSFQLASMVRSGDAQLEAARTLLMIPDYFQFLLSGEKRAEYTEATTSQLYDLRARAWSAETLRKLRIPAHIFPQVIQPGTRLGPLRAAVQAECGFSGALPCVAVASHDTASAVAAIPGLDETSVLLSSGTWSLMGVTADEPNLSDEFFGGGFTNEGSATGGVLLLKNRPGLWILQECVRVWEAAGRCIAWAELEEAAKQAAPFRSFIDPAAPELQAPADMCVAVQRFCAESGQPVPETPGEIARCVFESLSFSYRAVVESLARITRRELRTVRVVGGGCLNHFLCQMTADACGREVVAGPVEAAALGSGLLQAVATGHLRNLAEARAALAESVACDVYQPQSGAAWAEAYARYRAVAARG